MSDERYEHVSSRWWTELRRWIIECENCGKQHVVTTATLAPAGLPEGWDWHFSDVWCEDCTGLDATD